MNDHLIRRQRFDSLFEAHKVDIASYCGWRTESRADAEDAVSEVFLVAWRKLDSIPQGDGARAWLYATARRVTANTRRSGRRRESLADRISQRHDPVDRQSTATSAEEAVVHEALAMLNDRDREILLLVEWEGLRPADLGEVLGCQEVTARGRLHRARARFREAFESVDGQSAEQDVREIRKAQS
jgi:RNA polymerase sigma-70 factor (ECF subfamily)